MTKPRTSTVTASTNVTRYAAEAAASIWPVPCHNSGSSAPATTVPTRGRLSARQYSGANRSSTIGTAASATHRAPSSTRTPRSAGGSGASIQSRLRSTSTTAVTYAGRMTRLAACCTSTAFSVLLKSTGESRYGGIRPEDELVGALFDMPGHPPERALERAARAGISDRAVYRRYLFVQSFPSAAQPALPCLSPQASGHFVPAHRDRDHTRTLSSVRRGLSRVRRVG